MENYENENLNPVPEVPQPPVEEAAAPAEQSAPAEAQPTPAQEQPVPVQEVPQAYHNAGVGRKESPFADSPYVNVHRSAYQAPPSYEAPKPRKKKSGRKIWGRIVAAVLVLALVGAGCGVTAWTVNSRWEQRTQQMTDAFNQKIAILEDKLEDVSNTGNSVSGSPVAADGSLTPGQVYAQNRDSVVAISSTIRTMGYNGVSEGTSTGSGFILTANGYIVTNYHVVEGATAITVITYQGEEYTAQLKGYDAANDLAVLKADAEDLPTVTIGSSDKLVIGDMVVAIGNPLGTLTSTQTVGYISGKDRYVTTDSSIINMLQTDAAINPGNSGGPLFNMKGEVVGITSAKYSGTTSSGASIEGIGFAIPIDDVLKMIQDIVEFGYITGAQLGVTVMNMDETVAKAYGLPVGPQVQEINPGSCAEKAGIMLGDIIIDLGGYEIENHTDLSLALRKFSSGDTTTITVYRQGREVILTITLDEKAASQMQQQTEETRPMPSEGNKEEWEDYFGIK